MTRTQQTQIFLVAMIVALGIIFMMFQSHQDREAIRDRDGAACWSDSCQSRIAAEAAARLSAPSVVEASDDPADPMYVDPALDAANIVADDTE